jgi:phosphopantothenoylcysteine decarboxylase / phosphopantothenate---cysteine ligase
MMNEGLKGKYIVLGVCGGIAAYKSVELLRLLVKQGATVQVVMTVNAGQFVGPLTFEALSRQKVCSNLFAANNEAAIQHIEWAEKADAVVIAPATANIIAKLAHGLADDALSTFMLAVTCPVMVCPSMNSQMYTSLPVQRNLDLLENDGRVVLTPEAGELACGTTGPGRLPEPAYILDRLIQLLAPKDFKGRSVLVTAGPTREAIDPVRFLGNPSSGKMGFALARAAEMRGAEVTLVAGPTALPVPIHVNLVRVTTAAEMATAVLDHLDGADIVIKSAAVADYRPVDRASQKIKKTQDLLTLELERTQDILMAVVGRKTHQVVVGFAAETEKLNTFAVGKLKEKQLDLLVGNLVGSPDTGFESDTNQVTLYNKDGSQERLARMPKTALAHLILDRIGGLMAG